MTLKTALVAGMKRLSLAHSGQGRRKNSVYLAETAV